MAGERRGGKVISVLGIRARLSLGLSGVVEEISARPSRVTVGLADMAVTDRAGDMLITFALGSCLGISVYDPVVGVCGLAHCMLPLARMDPAGAESTPGKYVDTGVIALFRSACELGAQRERLIVRAAGGATIPDHGGRFRIGERNCAALRKVLWQNGLAVGSEDVGGEAARTMCVCAATGRVTITSDGREMDL